uniref:Uncharacterized protein n=1 Tax=Musca domestica TaxID=7370 RepID=A0A1I8M1D2_MUSDO
MYRLRNLAQTDPSKVNAFSVDSPNINPTVNVENNRRLVNQLIDKIFDERKGLCDVSSSQCSSLRLQPSEYSYDKRLQYWKNVLKDREVVKEKIYRNTSKSPCKDPVLHSNRATTIDERDKQTIKKILDYAERLRPERLCGRKVNALKEKCDQSTIEETLPKAERVKGTQLEICGLPGITKREILGGEQGNAEEHSSKWLMSKHLEQRIEENREDIERVIEFYPDIENLQIVGEGLMKALPSNGLKHNSQIELLMPEEKICDISSESKELGLEENPCPDDIVQVEVEPIEYGFKINEQIFLLDNGKCVKPMEIEISFNSQPFVQEVKRVVILQNLGQKILNFKWLNRSYYKNNAALLKPLDNEFVFDHRPFRLCRGERKEFHVLYQPRRVGITKTKWVLKVDPSPFKHKTEDIVMQLQGNCEPHVEYRQKLQDIRSEVISKSNWKMMRKLTRGLGDLTPAIKPIECPCPYQRPLTELEIFQYLNPHYKCERYHDLESLKDIYQRVKKPRDKLWNLRVDSLKEAILRFDDPEKRVLYFNELCDLLGRIINTRGGEGGETSEIVEKTERFQTSILYVRGLLGKCVDEWEKRRESLENGFLKFLEASNANGSGGDASNSEKINHALFEKQLRNSKSFQDSLYMQTYSVLCNFVEDIVNVIESAELY